jgi:hypothetical protein
VAGGALAAGSLQAAIASIRKLYRGTGKNKVVLNLMPEYLVVPPELQFTAEILVQSAERVVSSSGGTFNPLRGKLNILVENRIGTIGVTDPATGTAYTGVATYYYLFTRPGYHVKVAYRRGTGRAVDFHRRL